MTLTPGKWIAFQTPSQKANITEAPGEHWSVGIEHHDAMCHGVARGGGYMLFSGIGTKADALAMAAAPALLEALEDARTSLSITRTNIMCEIGRCADPSESRWEGVPEQLAKRIAKIDAAISLARGEVK